METKKSNAHIQTYLLSERLALFGNKFAQPGEKRVRSLRRGSSHSAYRSEVHRHALFASVLWPCCWASNHIVLIHRYLEVIHMLLAKPCQAVGVGS